MASNLRFDEVNSLDGQRQTPRKPRHVPYAEFFGEMYIDAEDRDTRIEMANALDDVFLFLFATLATFKNPSEITLPLIYELAENGYKDAILPFLTAQALESNTIDNIIANQVRFIVDTTIDNFNDPYYFSEDRAMFIAENQTNAVMNAANNEIAIAAGYKFKRWVAMQDQHVRSSQREVNGQTVPIMTPFSVGNSLMMHPCDDSLGAGAEEIVNCRCVVEYRNEDGNEVRDKAKSEAEEYAENWEKASLREAINRFGAAESDVSDDGRKTEFTSFDGRYTILNDNYGNYFRIRDNEWTGRRHFTDLYGENASNVEVNGKIRGRTRDEYKQATHFFNADE